MERGSQPAGSCWEPAWKLPKSCSRSCTSSCCPATCAAAGTLGPGPRQLCCAASKHRACAQASMHQGRQAGHWSPYHEQQAGCQCSSPTAAGRWCGGSEGTDAAWRASHPSRCLAGTVVPSDLQHEPLQLVSSSWWLLVICQWGFSAILASGTALVAAPTIHGFSLIPMTLIQLLIIYGFFPCAHDMRKPIGKDQGRPCLK